MIDEKPYIVALTDGKAGHETQTQGIIQLLNQTQAYRVEWLSLKLPNKWVYRILKWLTKFVRNTQWLSYFFDADTIKQLDQIQVDYIVSAGGNTLLPNLLLKQYLQPKRSVKNLVASSLRGISSDFFDVVFTIHEHQAGLANYLYYPIAPNKMSALPLTREQAREHLYINDNEQVITVLIGANTKTVHIGNATQWAKILTEIRLQYPMARLLLTTSRRTSVEFEKELCQLCEQNGVFQSNDQQTWVAQGQSCDIKDYIKAANWILSSPDSTSMVAEVVMSGSKLLILYDESAVQDDHIRQQLKFLAEQHWLFLLNPQQAPQFSHIVQGLSVQNHTEEMTKKLNQPLAMR
ncbi:ELM1/GtrOC1 family putative glycosyltransferase [Acinetobacter pittii]|uniref:ELM1/GtrOC1 family putative glycosyltransferase n=1 Tax=Acinetobacter pittii TaxID=48296 RepID=UPI00300C4FD0